ncbi:GrpB domain, predicted nucleotidyltransferase, UPF0157 family [Planococcus glaciei]|uniref:GrpB family protein n=1 Tax=Planococcus glaciei TaxID=459472 RepID=UPI00089189E9|nr:GrpB family protein [Planococcus glaciei]SDH00372.1 GrpB domain, predicted nucleotidyltransferase, UPF0157 family [Planococcus glaciei]
MRKVVVTEYNPEWPRLFEEAATELKKVFGEECLAIHHFGSTSVEGMAAKPIIDLLPVVRKIETVDRFNGEMLALGYEPKGENGLPGRRYFQKGGDERSHHVHIYGSGNPEIKRHLAFRDYLKKHPKEAERYGTLKKKLAEAHPWDIEKYIQGKEQMAANIEKQAMEEI